MQHPRIPAAALGRGFLALLLACGLFVGAALGDVLVLKDGRRIEGVILSETSSKVKIRTRFGELEFARSEISEITKGKTRDQEYEEREKAAKTVEDFYALALWARDNKLRSKAKKCIRKVLEMEPQHAGANQYIGNVQYKGVWMTPEERDRRMKADFEAEMAEKGLVRYGERWVTPDEKKKLEAGLVLHEGEWLPFEQAQRAKGLEEFAGRWLPAAEALARRSVAVVEDLGELSLQLHLTDEAVIAGDVDAERLEHVGRGFDIARAKFNELYGVEPGLGLYGGRLAEFYLFNERSDVYQGTVSHFASLTPTVGEPWAEAVKKTHGFYWFDPYPCSSARRWRRSDMDLDGHCYHHFGHLMVNRLGYDGRLLPPWYDEAVAGVFEFEIHERNAVFCRMHEGTSRGTTAKGATFDFDPRSMREGDWAEVLIKALRARRVPSFDTLARKEFHELGLLDIATGMGIVTWIAEEGDLGKFHTELRRTAPDLPERVIFAAHERTAANDAAFQAAVGMGWREADAAWRKWILNR